MRRLAVVIGSVIGIVLVPVWLVKRELEWRAVRREAAGRRPEIIEDFLEE